MPCCALLILLIFGPRIALLAIWLGSTYLDRAFGTFLWPLLGFIFLPLTTLAYAWAINSFGTISGLGLVAVVLAAVIDLGSLFGGASKRPRRDVRV